MLIYLPSGRRELNVKALVGAFNQEKALVGAFSVITNLRMELFEALMVMPHLECCVIQSETSGHADREEEMRVLV